MDFDNYMYFVYKKDSNTYNIFSGARPQETTWGKNDLTFEVFRDK
jgi:hypothetical protein